MNELTSQSSLGLLMLIRSRLRHDGGQTTVEYAMVVTLVVILAGVSLAALQGSITTVVNDIGDALASVASSV